MTEYAEDPMTATKPQTREEKDKEAVERSKQIVDTTPDSVFTDPITESFNWTSSHFKKLRSKDQKKVLIKVVAAHAGDVSLNQRKYIAAELMKSARTFIGKPITINHDPKQRIGVVSTADYEDDQLEIIGEISIEPYVSLIRHKRPYFSGVSIEANYRYNVCPICRERFESDEEFYIHQEKKHLIKSDGVKEPHGMVGAGLSMVTKDQQPGIPTASYELMETAKGLNRLYEMVVKDKEGFGITAQAKIPVSKAGIAKMKEQDKEPCPEGEHRNEEGVCVKDVTEQEPCPEGEHRDKEGECVKDEPVKKDEEIKELTLQINNAWIINANKALKEYADNIDKLFAEVAELKQPKSLKETTSFLQRKLAETIVRIDNLEEKQKGQFKGRSKQVQETVTEYATDPLTGG